MGEIRSWSWSLLAAAVVGLGTAGSAAHGAMIIDTCSLHPSDSTASSSVLWNARGAGLGSLDPTTPGALGVSAGMNSSSTMTVVPEYSTYAAGVGAVLMFMAMARSFDSRNNGVIRLGNRD